MSRQSHMASSCPKTSCNSTREEIGIVWSRNIPFANMKNWIGKSVSVQHQFQEILPPCFSRYSQSSYCDTKQLHLLHCVCLFVFVQQCPSTMNVFVIVRFCCQSLVFIIKHRTDSLVPSWDYLEIIYIFSCILSENFSEYILGNRYICVLAGVRDPVCSNSVCIPLKSRSSFRFYLLSTGSRLWVTQEALSDTSELHLAVDVNFCRFNIS